MSRTKNLVGILLVVALLVTMSLGVFAKTQVHLKGMVQKDHVPYGLAKKYQMNEVGPYIVTFTGPITEEMKAGVESKGGELVEYVPDFAFITMMTPAEVLEVKKLSYIEGTEVFEPAYKVHPSLKDEYGNIVGFEDVTVNIITFGDVSAIDDQIINSHGKKIAHSNKKVAVQVHSSQLVKFAQSNAVKFIERVPVNELFNDIAKGLMDVDDLWNLNYDGSGQIVTVCDTGLDTGVNDNTMHEDFQGRIDAIIPLGRTTADDPHGHGTHVSGSVLGDGTNSNGQIKGMAPAAHLVMQSVLDSSGGLGGLPNDLNTLFAEGYSYGSRIHTNSWGASVNGDYNSDSQAVDEFTWDNRDMIILFAASNDGDAPGTIGSPGTAKNCITVGASENDRYDKGSYADDPTDIAVFSSRGPCEDGRIKPDIVAPGTWILSTRSSLAADSAFWDNYDANYAYMGGTSMATPLTAGAVAVAREYMQTEWNHTPTGAMMKAAIINGGTDLGYGFPSMDQGWGRVSLINSLVSKEYEYSDEEYSLATGQTQSFSYGIESSYTPLKISLVWTDYPGSTTASMALVNDLDLKVTSPSGTVYYGNDFTSPYTTVDRTNNVENVFISNPELGTYTVEVIAYNVPQGPQPFALFSSADFGVAVVDNTPPTCSLTAPNNGDTVSGTVTLSATATDDNTVNRVEFYVDGSLVGTDTSSPYSYDWTSNSVVNGSHTIMAKAIDGSGNEGNSSSISVTVDNQVTIIDQTDTFTGKVANAETDSYTINVTASGTIELTLSWSDGKNLSLYLLDPNGNQVASGTTSISYNNTTTGTYQIDVYRADPGKPTNYTLMATYPVVQ